MKIGIYGGSFNPPHIGHIRGAAFAKEKLGLDKLILIPAGDPPHKALPAGSPTGEQRLQMLRLALQDIPGVEVSDMELRREGKSYTWQTVEALRGMYPHGELTLIMGTDMYLCFQDWACPERITAQCKLAVLFRGEKGEAQRLQAHREATGIAAEFLENPVTDISSTQIRAMLRLQCAGEHVSARVLAYILENKLYFTGGSCKDLSLPELEAVAVSLHSPKRVAHVLGCRDMAVDLAKIYGENPVSAARAALLHDITKTLDGPLQLTLAREYGMILDDFSILPPQAVHALTGSWVARHIFGESREVVDAIRYHTVGRPGMTTLEKIVYMADAVEPTRNYPSVEMLRELTRRDLDRALRKSLELTIERLTGQGREVFPGSLETLQYLQNQ